MNSESPANPGNNNTYAGDWPPDAAIGAVGLLDHAAPCPVDVHEADGFRRPDRAPGAPGTKSLTIVIPALNEKNGIARTINAVPKGRLGEMGYEIQVLVVDNGSTDGTGAIAAAAGADVVTEPRRGYGSAYKAGFSRAWGDIIATADADATYPLEDIPRLVRMLEDDQLDFITTNRFALMDRKAMSTRNRIGNGILNLATRVLFRVNLADSQSGMWVFKKDILQRLVLRSNTPLSQELKIEAIRFARCRWREVPIAYRVRVGKPKLGGWKVGATNLLELLQKRIHR